MIAFCVYVCSKSSKFCWRPRGKRLKSYVITTSNFYIELLWPMWMSLDFDTMIPSSQPCNISNATELLRFIYLLRLCTFFYWLLLLVFRPLHLQFNYWLQSMENPDNGRLQQVLSHAANGLPHNQLVGETSFLSGIKQRLLSFIFQAIWNEETDPCLVSYLKFRMIFLLDKSPVSW